MYFINVLFPPIYFSLSSGLSDGKIGGIVVGATIGAFLIAVVVIVIVAVVVIFIFKKSEYITDSRFSINLFTRISNYVLL